jgi:phosphoribosyl-ATP pyrophosphohydrolase
MEMVEHPHVKNREFGIDFTQKDVRKKIGPEAWEAVVRAAEILQEENDVPFERGDLVFHPASGRLYEVGEVLDMRHRMALET